MHEANMTEVVEAVGRMKFEGNIVPRAWYRTIVTKTSQGSSTADLLAIVVLAEIVFWYRPGPGFDDVSGMPCKCRKKFAADKLQLGYADLAARLGLTKRQVESAVGRLVDQGLISREFRTVTGKDGRRIPNVMFLEPNPVRLSEVSVPPPGDTAEHGTSGHHTVAAGGGTLKRDTCLAQAGDTTRSSATYPTLKRRTNTEITTESTTEITQRNSGTGSFDTRHPAVSCNDGQATVQGECLPDDTSTFSLASVVWSSGQNSDQGVTPARQLVPEDHGEPATRSRSVATPPGPPSPGTPCRDVAHASEELGSAHAVIADPWVADDPAESYYRNADKRHVERVEREATTRATTAA